MKNSIHEAFPSCYQESLESLQKGIHITTSGTTFSVTLESERLEIPVRIYGEELENSKFEALSFEERILLACLFSRHHNGYVRQKYAEILIHVSNEMPWVFPYIVRLVGEYVIDITHLIYREKERIPNKVIRQFFKQNKSFMQTTKQRMISYWNEYYRNDYPHKKDYVGMHLFSYWEQLVNNPTLNQLALEQFESNEYKKALQLFEEAVQRERTVQSLNNLAWIYLSEEEKPALAKPLLLEAIQHKPSSHFPYSMLGEMALKERDFERAQQYLQQSIEINPSPEAIENLAISKFGLGLYQEAAKNFSTVAGHSDLIRLHEVVSFIKYDEFSKAKVCLAEFCEDADDFVGSIEMADVYIEMQCYERARDLFSKEWDERVGVSLYLLNRYGYVLYKLEEQNTLQLIIVKAMMEIEEELKEAEEDLLNYPEEAADFHEKIKALQEQKAKIPFIIEELQGGFIPSFEYEMYPTSGCYLFGCRQHGHPEYKESRE